MISHAWYITETMAGHWNEEESEDRVLVVGMSYTSMVRVMVLDKMSGAEEKLDGVEQRLDQVEDVCMTNNNIQNMEMTLGVEIYKVAGNLQNTMVTAGVSQWRIVEGMGNREVGSGPGDPDSAAVIGGSPLLGEGVDGYGGATPGAGVSTGSSCQEPHHDQ
jgi:hypothetical protein